MSIPPPPPPARGDQPPSWQPAPPQPGFQQQPYQPGYPPQPGSPAQPGYPAQPGSPGQPGQQWQAAPVMEKTKAPIGWVAAGAAVACAVSPFLPWATGNGESVNGFAEFGFDDRFVGAGVLFFAALAAILLVIGTAIRNRVLLILGAVSAGFATLMPFADIGKINDLNDLGGDISPGAGIFVALGTGALSLVCSIIAAVQTKKRPVGVSR